MAALVYTLCAATCLACAILLLRTYRQTRFRLALWSGLCFAGLTVNNVLVVVDRIVVPDVDLFGARVAAALVGMAFLLFGLVWEGE